VSHPWFRMSGMGRRLRSDIAGSWYHVFNRGVDRQPVFFCDRDRVEFERLLGVIADRYGVRVHAYCLMTNHYHLLLECPGGGLSDAMHDLTSTFVRHVNERRGRDGPLFRGRFAAKPVLTSRYLRCLVRYIHRNPLAFCSLDEARRYRWGSHRIYDGSRATPRWFASQHVLSMFESQAAFDSFVFGEAIVRTGGLGPAGWSDAIDLVIDEQIADGSKQRLKTSVALLLLDRLDGTDRAEVAATLEFPSAAALRTARSRARRTLATRPELARVVGGVLRLAA